MLKNITLIQSIIARNVNICVMKFHDKYLITKQVSVKDVCLFLFFCFTKRDCSDEKEISMQVLKIIKFFDFIWFVR